MKKILILLLVTLCPLAHADWSLLSTSEKRDLFYVDFDTLRYGKYPGAWFLIDFGKRTPEAAFSAKYAIQADCKSHKTKLLSQAFYANNGGKGDLISSTNTAGDWGQPQPNTPAEQMYRFLCRKN